MTKKIIAVETEEGAGAKVKRLFPTEYLENYDPFVLLDEFFVTKNVGFPEHMHRGFEAVTYMLDGSFNHKDDLGNDEEVFAGEVMRFTAGRGIIHSEMPGKSKMNHGLQLWVNLPRKFKKIKPSFQKIDTVSKQKSNGAVIRTIVGKNSEVKLKTPVLYQDIKIDALKSFKVVLPDTYHGFLYVIKGELETLKKGEA